METISAKIPEDLKRALEDEGINVSEAVRDALEAEVTRRRRERLVREAESLASDVDDMVDVDDVVDRVVADVRESRAER